MLSLSRRKGFTVLGTFQSNAKQGVIGRSVASVSSQRKEYQAKNSWSIRAADISRVTMEKRRRSG